MKDPLRKIVYGGIILALAVIAVLIAMNLLGPMLADKPTYMYYAAIVLVGLVAVCIGFFISPRLVRQLEKATERAVNRVSQMATTEIVSIAVGLILGLIIASLIGTAVARISVIGPYLAVIAVLLFGYIGLLVGYRKREDFANLIAGRHREPAEKPDKADARKDKRDKKKSDHRITPKILDTSVIIDGRIADIYRTGFIEGELVVANFVLEELRHIADSGDSLKRNRGRGGLDCLNAMQGEFADAIVITEKDYPEVAEVDSKLLRLTQDLHGVIVTNDFNLNKVAKLQGVRVLNINELSNAVKPIVLPGEEMTALIIKEGKEASQGVAYLDDGTMIVVENGRRYLGRRLQVVVTSILQTAAGRMVFARPKLDKNGAVIEAVAD